jgi:hypothetical protein
VAIVANTALYLFAPFYYPALWVAGAFGLIFGLRGFDRRTKLRIAPDGIMYSLWGDQAMPWTDFQGFSVFQHRGYRFIEPQMHDREKFLRNVPQLVRLGAWINQLVRRPGYYINPSQLDTNADSIIEALSTYTTIH